MANFIDASPALRHTRRIGAYELRNAMACPPGTCTWCGQQVPKGRFTWCSKECIEAFKVRCDPQHARKAFIAKNGFLTELEWIGGRARPKWVIVQCSECKLYGADSLFELDHIVPVCEGGGLCDLDNYRLLCFECHDKQTDDLFFRRRGYRLGLKGVRR